MYPGNAFGRPLERKGHAKLPGALFVILSVVNLFPLAVSSAGSADAMTSGPVVDRRATDAVSTESSRHQVPSPEELEKMIVRRSPRLGEKVYSTTEAKAARLRMPDLDSSRPVVLARYAGTRVFTTEDLSNTLELRKPRSVAARSIEQIQSLPPDELRDIVRDLVYELLIYQRALKDGITTEIPDIKARLNQHRGLYLSRALTQSEIEPRMKLMDEKSAREHYEAKKSELYVRPESLVLQEIFLSAYRQYVAAAGDTPRGIARRLSGSEKEYLRILRDDDFHFPRFASEDQKAEYPPENLREGERLLVPLASDELTSKARLAEQIHARLLAGEDFMALARRYSDADSGTSGPEAFTPDYDGMTASLREALRSLSSTTLTQVLRGAHGWSIFRRVDYKSTSTMSFDEVRSSIAPDQDARRKSMEQVMRDIVDELGEKHGLKIHTEILKRPDYQGENPLTADTPIVTAPGFTYTLEQFRRDMVPTTKSWTGMTYEERLSVAKSAPSVMQYLVDKEASARELDKTPQFQREMESKAIIEITGEYLRRAREKKTFAPTDEELRDFYTKHIDRYTSPAMVTIREITKRVDRSLSGPKGAAAQQAAKDELLRLRNAIKTQADFEQQARRQSESLATRSRGGLIGTVATDFRGDVFKNQILQLKPGEISDPFIYNNEAFLIRLDKQAADVVRPFEEVLPRVRAEYLREMPAKLQRQERDAVLGEAGFELLF